MIEKDRLLLVTGGAGFIGSNFVRYYLENHPDDQIINLDALTYAGYLPGLNDAAGMYPDRYTFVRGNIGNRELVDHLFSQYRPNVVVNFAAESHNSRAVINPGIFFETNVIGTQKLMDASLANGVERFHHVSTCEVYGDMALDSSERFTEHSPYKPRSPYNASKAAADLTVKAYYETFSLPITISNCSNNYGPYQFPEKVIPRFVTSALRKEPLTLYRQSHNKREWLHVKDHCQAIDLILQKGRIGETYNIGSGKEADVEELASRILKQLGLDESYKTYVEDRPGLDRRYLLDSSKIKTELGWTPKIEFEKGLTETIRWYVQNAWWWEPLLERVPLDESRWNPK